jgi:hypothetical protein
MMQRKPQESFMSTGIAKWLGLVVLLQSTAALGAVAPPFSAKPFEIIGMSETTINNDWAFRVMYRTGQAIHDKTALRTEAAILWQRYFPDVEATGDRQAVIVAIGREPLALEDERVETVFERNDDGVWRMVEVAEAAKLDEDYVRAFIARLDWAEQHKATDTFLLFLADDWYRTTKGEGKKKKSEADIGRADFPLAMREVFLGTEMYRHKREILSITIDPDGRKAQVDSRESDRVIMHANDDEESILTARTKHFLEIRDNSVVVTKTAYVIEKAPVAK